MLVEFRASSAVLLKFYQWIYDSREHVNFHDSAIQRNLEKSGLENGRVASSKMKHERRWCL